MSLQILAQETTGNIVGKITDKEFNNEPLPFANVILKGEDKGTTTDAQGLFNIGNLQPGTYTVEFSYVGYETITIEDVEVIAGKVTEVNTAMGATAATLDEVVITTVARRDSEVALLLDQKGAINIKESIGSQELAKMGVSSVAVATTKISGVSNSEGSGDVFIRGLGDRYLVTTMNGLPVPSDDVERKNIDLDLFPTRVVSNISISKAYTSNLYGDQASGNIDIATRELVGTEELSVGFKIGANENAIDANQFLVGPFQDDISVGFHNSNLTTTEAMLGQTWNTQVQDNPVNYSFNVAGGEKFGDNFRTFATLSQKTSFEFREEFFQEFDGNNVRDNFTDINRFKKTTSTSALLDLRYDYNDNDDIKFVSLFLNKTEGIVFEAGRNGEGFVFDEVQTEPPLDQFIRDQNVRETQVLVNQFIGENNFGQHKVDWAVGLNIVNADEPNRIRNEINFNEDRIELGRTGDFQQRKSNQEIDDFEVNARINDSFKVTNIEEEDNENGLKLDVGGDFRNKTRDFLSQFVGLFETSPQPSVFPNSLDNLTEVFTQENIDNGLLAIDDRKPDVYDATLNIYAGYLVSNYKLDKWNFNLGLRYEVDEIETTWDVLNSPNGSTTKDYDNFLPSINIKYELNEEHNFRLSASKTITLPEFKEIAPFQYVDPRGQVSQGNPDVEASENYNLDLKWEFFPSRSQLISLTGFYKQINDPINRVLLRSSAGIFSYFNSGEQAEILGIELDSKIDIISKEADLGYSLRSNVNVTRMWHEQDLKTLANGNTFAYNGKTETGLQGASDWIFNGNLTFETTNDNPWVANVSANFASENIFSLGNPETQTNPDIQFNEEIIEKGFVILNAIVRKDINENLTLQLSGKNLLNPEIERTQIVQPINNNPEQIETEETVRSYKNGAQVSFGVTYNF
ncbi:TonB-dependent receptor [Mesohalobacter halotolerans]|nr:TonB-dependent receptor [Mesohalobacter halotolerans]